MDDNIEQMLVSNEMYQYVKEGSTEVQRRREVASQASQMTQNLEEHAAQQQKEQLKDIKKLRNNQLVHLFVGNDRDRLIHKFVENMKSTVHSRRVNLRHQTNERFFEKIVRQKSYKEMVSNAKRSASHEQSQKKELSMLKSSVV